MTDPRDTHKPTPSSTHESPDTPRGESPGEAHGDENDRAADSPSAPRVLARGHQRSGLAAAGDVRWVAVEITEMVETLRRRWDLSPVSAVALGQLLSGAALMHRLQLKTPVRLSLTARGDGSLGTVTAEADSDGRLRGTVANPRAEAPEGAAPLAVGAALGGGRLVVTRYYANGPSYESQVSLDEEPAAGGLRERADDEEEALSAAELNAAGDVPSPPGGDGFGRHLSVYLQRSEQTQSAVLLGVLARPEGITSAGGLILEALPGTDDDLLQALEERLAQVPVSRTLEAGGVDALLDAALGELDLEQLEECSLTYACSCQRESLRLRLAALPQDDREHIADQPWDEIEVVCSYCAERYLFTPEELGIYPTSTS